MNRRNPDTEIGLLPSHNVVELVEQYTGFIQMPTQDEQGKQLAPLPPVVQAAQILACALLHGMGLVAKALRHVAKASKAIGHAIHALASNVNTLASANAAIAEAISSHGEAVSAAIDVHSQSTDDLAQALETRAP
ncbi:MAG: hypothetical protein Q4F13_09630 [Pseudomonadota bacterium]|nr:hypothetical protein [Pseudomonadota bacterium]